MDILLLDLFVHGQGWIPSLFPDTHEGNAPISIEYNGNEYILRNPSVLRWISSEHGSTISIPESIFYDVIGDFPELLPSTEEKEGTLYILENVSFEISPTCVPRMMVLNFVTMSLLLNYLGVYNLTWKLQGLIYTLRDHLPSHWKDLGGVRIYRSDERFRKWNGDMSPFMKSQFNGMYIPYGLSEMSSLRYIPYENISSHPEMDVIVSSPLVQDLSFGLLPSPLQYTVSAELINAIAIVGTGRNILKELTPRDKAEMPIEEIVSLLKNRKDDSIVRELLSVVPIERIQQAGTLLIENESVPSIIQLWDVCTFAPDDIKEKKLSKPLVDLLSTKEREEVLEEMTEEQLLSIAHSLDVPIPYDEGEISSTQLIQNIQNKISQLLNE